jgi:hypothetical protein
MANQRISKSKLFYQDKAIENWGVCLLDELPKALDYVVKDGHCVEENKQAW